MKRVMRRIRPALHVTVEGDAEQIIIGRLKAFLTAGQNGPWVRVHNARGKGALHVIRTSIRCANKKDFAVRAVVLDTDTDWDDRARKIANQAGLVVIEMAPCLEAKLLCAKRIGVPERTADCKEAFMRHFGGPAHDQRVLDRNFPIDALHAAAQRCEVGQKLLQLFD